MRAVVVALTAVAGAITNGGTFTGGATGLDVDSIERIFGINFDQLRNAYYLVIAALFLCLLVTSIIVLPLQHGKIVASGAIADLRDNSVMRELYWGHGRRGGSQGPGLLRVPIETLGT